MSVWTQASKAESAHELQHIANIVCPIELTEEAEPLLQFANNTAETFGAKVHLLHVVPEQDVREYRYFDVDFHRRLSEMATLEITGYEKNVGTNFPLHITSGHIAQDMAELAQRENADLILIGRGKTRGVFGSLRSHSADIIRTAPAGTDLFRRLARPRIPWLVGIRRNGNRSLCFPDVDVSEFRVFVWLTADSRPTGRGSGHPQSCE